jgi:hypothetical protein
MQPLAAAPQFMPSERFSGRPNVVAKPTIRELLGEVSPTAIPEKRPLLVRMFLILVKLLAIVFFGYVVLLGVVFALLSDRVCC